MTSDESRFEQARLRVLREQTAQGGGIGRLSEKTVHKVFKYLMEPDDAFHEIPLSGGVADILRGGEMVEIQTQKLGAIREKLAICPPGTTLTVVYPIPCRRWLCRLDAERGTVSSERKSPKTGRLIDALVALYDARSALRDPRLTVTLFLCDMKEYRVPSTRSRRGTERYDRVPLSLVARLDLREPSDYRALLPEGLEEPFTAKTFTSLSRLRPKDASRALAVLRTVGAVEQVGTRGRAYLYRVAGEGKGEARGLSSL